MLNYGGYKFAVATTRQLIRETQKLRYKVYVEELGYERPLDHFAGLEMDSFDPSSIHVAALDRTDQALGTLRLVLPSTRGFPSFKLVPEFRPEAGMSIAECSRLAIHPDIRQASPLERRGAPLNYQGVFQSPNAMITDRPGGDRRRSTMLLKGLTWVCFQVSLHLNVTHWLLLSERSVYTMLKDLGIPLKQIGEPVQFHGEHVPYLADCTDMQKWFRIIEKDINLSRKTPVKAIG
jgi:N-acyl amino acid synthase of PEP-CTERM/exosortase system